MRSKGLWATLIVVALCLCGAVGLHTAPGAEAGDLAGITAFNPTSVLVGGSASVTLTFYDDRFGSNISASVPGATITNSSVVRASDTTVSCSPAAGPSGLGTAGPVVLTDASCDSDSVAQAWQWTLTVLCTMPGTYTLTFTPGAGGSILPGTFGNQTLTCLSSAATGTNTISLRKVDQFGQALIASFSIQQAPFWVEVARVNLGNTPDQNPCATDGTGGINCALTGVVTPVVFSSGLPNGTYRIVEVAGPNSYCTLAGVYNGFSYSQGAIGAANSPYWGTPLVQPYTITLPDANPLDLTLTFVNSCIVPGVPSAATSGIAVVIGGSQPGILDTTNIQTVTVAGTSQVARLDIRVQDAKGIPIPNAHVTVVIDRGFLAVRQDNSMYPPAGYEVIEPTPGAVNFGSHESGDRCSQFTDGTYAQSTSTGSFSFPYNSASPQVQDGYTNADGIISACVYGLYEYLPGNVSVQAIVESPGQGGLYNGSTYYNPTSPSNLSLPNYLAAPSILLKAQIPVVGEANNITITAAPTTVTCGEKATITVTVKDDAGQNEPDRTRVELTTNYGGVIGGTIATYNLPITSHGIDGVSGQTYPQASSAAEVFNGVATAYLLTSTNHVGPYEVVAVAGAVAQTTVTCTLPGASASGGGAAPALTAGAAKGVEIHPPNTGDAGLLSTPN